MPLQRDRAGQRECHRRSRQLRPHSHRVAAQLLHREAVGVRRRIREGDGDSGVAGVSVSGEGHAGDAVVVEDVAERVAALVAAVALEEVVGHLP